MSRREFTSSGVGFRAAESASPRRRAAARKRRYEATAVEARLRFAGGFNPHEDGDPNND